jgi:beta-phosphoglucomutase family hydrolase
MRPCGGVRSLCGAWCGLLIHVTFSQAAGPGRFGLPDGVRACLFDLDGVITQTAKVHAAAWKEMFDAFLRQRDGDGFTPFDIHGDYDRYVDGLPRADGVRTFLRSRNIDLPEGDPDDPPTAETVNGLGNRKNDIVQRRIREDGVEVYEGSVRYLHAVRAAGLRTAVVSSSANTAEVLQVTGLTDLFDARVDGQVARERHLPGKPKPDTFLAGAAELGVEPTEAAVFEDALAGVEAGRAGGFGIVVGVDRVGQAAALKEHGADVVVQDLDELLGEAA